MIVPGLKLTVLFHLPSYPMVFLCFLIGSALFLLGISRGSPGAFQTIAMEDQIERLGAVCVVRRCRLGEFWVNLRLQSLGCRGENFRSFTTFFQVSHQQMTRQLLRFKLFKPALQTKEPHWQGQNSCTHQLSPPLLCVDSVQQLCGWVYQQHDNMQRLKKSKSNPSKFSKLNNLLVTIPWFKVRLFSSHKRRRVGISYEFSVSTCGNWQSFGVDMPRG